MAGAASSLEARGISLLGESMSPDSLRDLPHYVRILLRMASQRVSTAQMRLVARYWGVSLGRGCAFVGRASLVRRRQSVIRIGPNGLFLSAPTSNRHGLNRPVMISTLRPGAEIVIGSDANMSGTVICAAASVRIGDRVMLGANTTITDTDGHPLDFRERYAANYGLDPRVEATATAVAPVVIEDDVFIGMHAIVLKGVTIGRGAVVAAGSIVTRDIPADAIAGGTPAQILNRSQGE